MTAIQLQQLILDNRSIGKDIIIPAWEANELFNDIKELYTALDEAKIKGRVYEI
jgi:hypothetical protein